MPINTETCSSIIEIVILATKQQGALIEWIIKEIVNTIENE